jgi:anti-anti-sigma factor
VVLLALIIFGLASALVAGSALTAVVGGQLDSRAEENADRLARSLDQQITSLRVLSLGQSVYAAVKLANLQYPTSQETIQRRLGELDAQWATAADDSGIVRSRVSESPAAASLREYQTLEPANVELIIADGFGGLVAATERTSDYNQSDEAWWQTARAGQIYFGQPELDASTGVTALIIAVPILNPDDGSTIGVIRSTYSFDAIVAQLRAVRVGETGGVTLVLSADTMLDETWQLAPVGAAEREGLAAAAAAPYAVRTIGGRERVLSVAPVGATPEIRALGWQLLFYQDTYEALAPLLSARTAQLLAALASLAGAAALATIVARRITAPLTRLTAVARGLGEGDLSRRVGLGGRDEIGRLGRSFDAMADALEERVRAEHAANDERLRLQDEVIRVQRDTLRELATPLIPLNDDVLLLPLVGSIDGERAEQIFQALLQGVAERRARRVVIDLTGIPSLDSEVAATLLRAAQGVRLIGAEVALTGISASLALTLVALDLPLDQIAVRDSLESALRA